MMRQVLPSTFLSWTLVSTVGIFAWSASIPAKPALAQDITPRILTVTGQGSERIQTTRAQVELGVEIQGRTVTAVQEAVARQSAAIIGLLRDRSVEKLQTTAIGLNPRYAYSDGTEQLVGYVGFNFVSFEVPVDQVGQLIDAAVDAGANQIRGIRFVASETATAAAREAALQQATADAQQQANSVLEELNLTAAEIIGIQVDGAAGPTATPRLLEIADVIDVSEEYVTPVVGGEQSVQATVTLQIRY